MKRGFRISGNSLADYILVAIIIGLVGLILRVFDQEGPYSVSGYAEVIDGDSLKIDDIRVRLVGIDAPEGPQTCEKNGRIWPCGRVSTQRLRDLIAGGNVLCNGEKYDQHNRLLGLCRVEKTVLNSWMVEKGWAVSYGDYEWAERSARQAKLGIWEGAFERPKVWRNKHMK